MNTTIQKNVFIIIQHNKVFLVNQLEEPIKELVYSTYSVVTIDDTIGISDAPHYRIENIPFGHSVLLEVLDAWEDGSIHYELVALKSVTHSLNTSQPLKQKKLSGLIKLPPQANCIVEKSSVDSGFIVDLNQQDEINKLYWQVEELKSYTDLTGNRFDIDNAQRRLWLMYSILKKGNFPAAQKLYDELNELLEVAMFFDKVAFSEKVNQLFKLIETKREEP